jgi:hypothetical protein
MDDRAKKHIKTIRSRVWQERDLISNLTSTVTDQNLRRLLRPTSHLLDKVEGFFLNPQILQEDRTPVALAKWLREADRVSHPADRGAIGRSRMPMACPTDLPAQRRGSHV